MLDRAHTENRSPAASRACALFSRPVLAAHVEARGAEPRHLLALSTDGPHPSVPQLPARCPHLFVRALAVVARIAASLRGSATVVRGEAAALPLAVRAAAPRIERHLKAHRAPVATSRARNAKVARAISAGDRLAVGPAGSRRHERVAEDAPRGSPARFTREDRALRATHTRLAARCADRPDLSKARTWRTPSDRQVSRTHQHVQHQARQPVLEMAVYPHPPRQNL